MHRGRRLMLVSTTFGEGTDEGSAAFAVLVEDALHCVGRQP